MHNYVKLHVNVYKDRRLCGGLGPLGKSVKCCVHVIVTVSYMWICIKTRLCDGSGPRGKM